jgi:ribulose-bisphosphate carboxylase large chain
MERIEASYLVETPLDLNAAADVLAGEQSTGTFIRVPGETDTLRTRHAAVVEQIEPQESVNVPGLPGSRPHATQFNRGVIRVSWPRENVGTNLPVLISTLQGNLYELAQFSGLRLLDFNLPDSFSTPYPGPRHGVSGTRAACSSEREPLIGNIIKPSVGLTPQETAQIVKVLAEVGIDFIKDDELMGNPPSSPFRERVEAVMNVINRHADKTGKRVMYAFNISDDLDTMLRNYDWIEANSGTCAMISLNSVGTGAAAVVSKHGNLVIHGHRNGWGMLNRFPLSGMDFSAYQKIWRLVGIDQLHVNGIENKFWEPDDSVVHSIECCRRPFLKQTHCPLPVVSSGQWGGQAFETYRRTQTTDLLYMAGGGIMGHPDGPTGGVTAIRDAWKNAVDGKSLQEAVETSPAFAAAVDQFSK